MPLFSGTGKQFGACRTADTLLDRSLVPTGARPRTDGNGVRYRTAINLQDRAEQGMAIDETACKDSPTLRVVL
jgi:hypothetical protein